MKNIFFNSLAHFAIFLTMAVQPLAAQEKKAANDFVPNLDYKSETKAAESAFIAAFKDESQKIMSKQGKLIGSPIAIYNGEFISLRPINFTDIGGLKRATKFDQRSGRFFVFFQNYKDRDGNTSYFARSIRVDDKGEIKTGHEGIWSDPASDVIEYDDKNRTAVGSTKLAYQLYYEALQNIDNKDSRNPNDPKSSSAARAFSEWMRMQYKEKTPTTFLLSQDVRGDTVEKSIYLVAEEATDPHEDDAKKKDRPVSAIHAIVTFELKKNPKVQFINFSEPGEEG
ncbi:MAG: hypothetical protein JWQ35_732 [Bacteriovoracaceae bacterium]|nr:hypothetical protein [Bacteriovoracaceae bacterium]